MSNQGPDAVYKIIAFVFAERSRARAVSNDWKTTAKQEHHKVIAHAVVEVDDHGKAHLHETGHGALGVGAGAAAGGLLGLIGGPAGLLVWAVAGAVIGGVAGKVGSGPIQEEDMQRLAAQMQPNTSAILFIMEDKAVDAFIQTMAVDGAQVLILDVSARVSAEIFHSGALPGEVPAHGTSYEINEASPLPGMTPHHAPEASANETPADAAKAADPRGAADAGPAGGT